MNIVLVVAASMIDCATTFAATDTTHSVSHIVEISADHSNIDNSSRETINSFNLFYGLAYKQYDASISAAITSQKINNDSDTFIDDIVIHGGIETTNNYRAPNNLYTSLSIKLPSNDKPDSYGTDKIDAGIFISHTQFLDQHKIIYSAGYIYTGNDATLSNDDIATIGIGGLFNNRKIDYYLLLDAYFYEPDSNLNPVELTAGVFYKLNYLNRIKVELSTGLNDDANISSISIGYITLF